MAACSGVVRRELSRAVDCEARRRRRWVHCVWGGKCVCHRLLWSRKLELRHRRSIFCVENGGTKEPSAETILFSLANYHQHTTDNPPTFHTSEKPHRWFSANQRWTQILYCISTKIHLRKRRWPKTESEMEKSRCTLIAWGLNPDHRRLISSSTPRTRTAEGAEPNPRESRKTVSVFLKWSWVELCYKFWFPGSYACFVLLFPYHWHDDVITRAGLGIKGTANFNIQRRALSWGWNLRIGRNFATEFFVG